MIEQIAYDNSIASITSGGVDLTIASDATVVLFYIRLNSTESMTATCGGVSMDGAQTLVFGSNRFQIFSLTNPPTGSNVELRISGPSITSGYFIAASYKLAGYTDADIREAGSSAPNVQTHSQVVTPDARKGWVAAFGFYNGESIGSLVFTSDDGSPTQRVNVSNGLQGQWAIHDTLEVANPDGGTTTMTLDPPGAALGTMTILLVYIRPKNKRGLIIN